VSGAPAPPGDRRGAIARLFGVGAAEAPRVVRAAAAGFCVLGGWFVIRPLRDAMGTVGKTGELQWLMLAVLGTMLALTPPLFVAASRLPRDRFVALAFRFFALSLLAFAPALARPGGVPPWAARAFFVWVSVQNFFALSIFWGTMADRFTHREGLRSFGLVAAGGTLGGLVGSLVTAGSVQRFGPLPLLALAAVLFELTVRLLRRVRPADPAPAGATADSARPLADAPAARAHPPPGAPADPAPPAAAAEPLRWASRRAIARVARSPYLLGIAGYVLCWALTSTFVYVEQIALAKAALPDPNARAAFFAKIEAVVQASSLVLQAFATGRVLRALGTGRALALLPALSLAGFAALAAAPGLGLLAAFQVARRTLDYGIVKPARELLFTVVDRDDKYKTKSVIDTVVYRGGDALGGVLASSVAPALGAPAAAFALPLCAVWLGLAFGLGAASDRRARASTDAEGEAETGAPPLANEAMARR
jgi:AAA family ATP:ADP antiporter